MTRQRATQSTYMVSIYDDPDASGALRFTFVPKSIRQADAEENRLRRCLSTSCPFRATGTKRSSIGLSRRRSRKRGRNWKESPAQRVTARHEWLEKLRKLVATVKGWADELDWATKAVDKKMEDAEIGNYKAPGLLLQQETVRLFLEPVARAAPGTEGVVDLYLMPSYDDIASLYYYNNRWNVHYVFAGGTHRRRRSARPRRSP